MSADNIAVIKMVAAWLLIGSFLIFSVGGILYTGRVILKWPAGQSGRYFYIERGFVMAAVMAALLGLGLLERLLEAAGDPLLASSALLIFVIGAALIMVAESFNLSRRELVYPLVIVFVVLTFLSEAVFGISILRTGLLPAWVGWAAVIWNLGWLVILPIARPGDIYYPWLHYIALLLIGITLLVGI
jgi:hypothetical protein